MVDIALAVAESYRLGSAEGVAVELSAAAAEAAELASSQVELGGRVEQRICLQCGSWEVLAEGSLWSCGCSQDGREAWYDPAPESDTPFGSVAPRAPPWIREVLADTPVGPAIRALRVAATWLQGVARLKERPGLVTIPLLSSGSLIWFWDADPASKVRTRPNEGRPAYTRSAGGSSLWTLGPPIFRVALIDASSCTSCSRPVALGAEVYPRVPGPLQGPRQFCVNPANGDRVPSAQAGRCGFAASGLRISGALAVSALQWGSTCVPALPTEVHPVPAWVADLPGPMADLDPDATDGFPLTILGNNVGGVSRAGAMLSDWIAVLVPDVILWQETWDPPQAASLLPMEYEAVLGSERGQGTGHLIAWRRQWKAQGARAMTLLDDRSVLAVRVEFQGLKTVLLVSVHLHPHATYPEKRLTLKAISALQVRVNPALSIIQGDFNCDTSPRSPLRPCLGERGFLHNFLRVLPEGQPTNFATLQGTTRSTSIDHMFVKGSLEGHTWRLIPTGSTHAGIFTSVSTGTRDPDPWAWKTFRWRRASSSQLDLTAAALNATWGWLALTRATPDQFVSALHWLCKQLIPMKDAGERAIRALEVDPPPYSADQLGLLADKLRARAQDVRRLTRAEALRMQAVTSSSRAALRIPRKPLAPYPELRPAPDRPRLTRAERLQEVSDQTSYTQEHRHLRIDHTAVAASSQPWEWPQSMIDYVYELPLSLFMELRALGLDPNDRQARLDWCGKRASGALVGPGVLRSQLDKSASLSTSVDNMPAGVLSRGGGGVLLGSLSCIHGFQHGIPTVLQEVPLYSLVKSGPPTVAKSYRPVALEPVLARKESGCAQHRLAETMEMSGHLTPEYFSYRSGHSPAFMALACRGAAEGTLRRTGSVAIGDHDESDAFLRVQREDSAALMGLLPGVWNWGAWAADFYSRLRIRPSTLEGFAPPYVSGEGHNQGDGFAGEGFQALQAAIDSTLRVSWDVRLGEGHGGAPLPAVKFTFSDDRRFFGTSLREVARRAEECAVSSRAVGRVVHPSKVEFFLIELHGGAPRLVETIVPGYQTATSTDPPKVVGIPLLYPLGISAALGPIHKAVRRFTADALSRDCSALLRVRGLHAFVLSKLDVLARGVYLAERDLGSVQHSSRRVYRDAFRLPKWAHSRFVTLPVGSGGAGAPLLWARCACRLAQTYLEASYGRNSLARAAVGDLLTATVHEGWEPEGVLLRGALAMAGSTIQWLPRSGLAEAAVLGSGDPASLRGVDQLYVVVDGSWNRPRMGWAAVIWHPLKGILLERYSGCWVQEGTACQSEWAGRLEGLRCLQGWSGSATFVSDAAAAHTRGMTSGPDPKSLLSPAYRRFMAASLEVRCHDVWTPAEHGLGDAGVLSELNRRAHDLAGAGASAALPGTVPWRSALGDRAVLLTRGSLAFRPADALEAVYQEIARAEHDGHHGPVSSKGAAEHLGLILESGEVADEAWARGLLLRLLRTQCQPAHFHGQHCPWCKARVQELRFHLQHRCPNHFVAGYCSAWRLVAAAAAAWRGGATRRARCGLQVQLGGAALRCTFDWDEDQPQQPADVTVRLSGLVECTGRAERGRELASLSKGDLIRGCLADMSREPCWSLAEAVSLASRTTEDQEQHPGLAAPEQVVLGWLTRGLGHWRMLTPTHAWWSLSLEGGTPDVPVALAVALGGDRGELVAALAGVPDAEPLAVLLRADDVGWVSPLCPRPMAWVPLAGPYAALVQHGLLLPSPGAPPPA